MEHRTNKSVREELKVEDQQLEDLKAEEWHARLTSFQKARLQLVLI